MDRFGIKDKHVNIYVVYFPNLLLFFYVLHIEDNVQFKCGEETSFSTLVISLLFKNDFQDVFELRYEYKLKNTFKPNAYYIG